LASSNHSSSLGSRAFTEFTFHVATRTRTASQRDPLKVDPAAGDRDRSARLTLDPRKPGWPLAGQGTRHCWLAAPLQLQICN